MQISKPLNTKPQPRYTLFYFHPEKFGRNLGQTLIFLFLFLFLKFFLLFSGKKEVGESKFRVFQYVSNIAFSEQFENTLLTILPRKFFFFEMMVVN